MWCGSFAVPKKRRVRVMLDGCVCVGGVGLSYKIKFYMVALWWIVTEQESLDFKTSWTLLGTNISQTWLMCALWTVYWDGLVIDAFMDHFLSKLKNTINVILDLECANMAGPPVGWHRSWRHFGCGDGKDKQWHQGHAAAHPSPKS